MGQAAAMFTLLLKPPNPTGAPAFALEQAHSKMLIAKVTVFMLCLILDLKGFSGLQRLST